MPFARSQIFAAVFTSITLMSALAGCSQDSKPDIEADSMSVLPAAPVPTVPAVVSVQVKNVGNKTAGAFAWTVTRNGEYNFATGTVPGLEQGESATISFSVLEPSPTTVSYLLIVNSNNAFQESNLENNTSSAVIGFGPTEVNPQVTSLVMSTPSTGNPTSSTDVVLTATIDSPLDAVNTVTDLNWTLTGVAILDTDSSDTFTTSPISGVIASIAPGQSVQQDIGIGNLDDRYFYTYTFTITTGVTNTDTDTANNSASAISISPTPSARAAVPARQKNLNFQLSLR